MKNIVLVFSMTLLLCCGGSIDYPLSTETTDKVCAESVDSIPIQINPFNDSLRIYFESPVDFYALKKKTQLKR